MSIRCWHEWRWEFGILYNGNVTYEHNAKWHNGICRQVNVGPYRREKVKVTRMLPLINNTIVILVCHADRMLVVSFWCSDIHLIWEELRIMLTYRMKEIKRFLIFIMNKNYFYYPRLWLGVIMAMMWLGCGIKHIDKYNKMKVEQSKKSQQNRAN